MSDAFEHSVDLESIDETRGLGRRTFLMGALATGAAVSGPFNYAAAARKRALPMANDGAFRTGVASGFPRPQGIPLWTRLAGLKQDAKLDLVIAKDRKFANVVEERKVVAQKKRDYTARTFVNDLDPDEQYFYRFSTNESHSEVGRFKTAPPKDSRKPVKIVFYSCQHFEQGYYNAQRAIAKEKDVDVVVFLGDYIYEYSNNETSRGVLDRTGRNKDGDVQFVDEYWQKYKLYKNDRDLRAMHAAHPFVAVWDDHEVEDNHAGDEPSSAQPDPNKTNLQEYPRRVPYNTRRLNGYKAFFNYMPRMRFKGDRSRIYEDYRIGKLVDLLLTDERQYRDRQPCDDEIITQCAEADDPRTMLGANQLDWFLRSLKHSKATWKIWGTQLMLMATRVAPGPSPPGIYGLVDSWEGYGYERKLILDFILGNNIQNVAAITGDIHTFFAGTAFDKGDSTDSSARPVIPEFVGGSATSGGLSEATGLPASALAGLAAVNPHISYYDFIKKGYGVLKVKPNEIICEFKTVDHTKPNAGTATTSASFRVPLGARSPQKITGSNNP